MRSLSWHPQAARQERGLGASRIPWPCHAGDPSGHPQLKQGPMRIMGLNFPQFSFLSLRPCQVFVFHDGLFSFNLNHPSVPVLDQGARSGCHTGPTGPTSSTNSLSSPQERRIWTSNPAAPSPRGSGPSR